MRSNSEKRRLWRLAAPGVTAVALAVGGCGITTARVPTARSLGNADVAVYVSEFTNDAAQNGRVVLFDRAGPTAIAVTGGINNPDLVWDEAGLFFMDRDTDYQLTLKGAEQEQRSRHGSILLGTVGGPGSRRVILFNDGLFDGHNHTGVGVYDGLVERSQSTVLDSFANSVGFCGGKLYLVGEADDWDDASEEWSELVWLNPGGEPEPKQIGRHRPGVFLGRENQPCVKGTVIGLWRPDSRDGQTPVELWHWRVSDGSVHRVKLVTSSGGFTRPDTALEPGSDSPQWIDGNELIWIDDLGTAWRSDLKTGKTSKIRDGMGANVGPIERWAKAGGYVAAFSYDEDWTNGSVAVYSVKDLSLVETRQLGRLDDVTLHGQVVLALAISPDYTPPEDSK